MAYANWMWIALRLAMPTLAAEIEFQGYAIETDGPVDARQILRVQGKRYAIPGAPAQVVGKGPSFAWRARTAAPASSLWMRRVAG